MKKVAPRPRFTAGVPNFTRPASTLMMQQPLGAALAFSAALGALVACGEPGLLDAAYRGEPLGIISGTVGLTTGAEFPVGFCRGRRSTRSTATRCIDVASVCS